MTARLDDGTRLSGHVVFYEPPLPPPLLRRMGSRLADEGLSALDRDAERAEHLLRQSLEMMVDAFLLDRRANADLFRQAHELGALIEQHFSCRWHLDEESGLLENRCGILALHSRVGFSPGGPTWGRCSICEAEDFQCDHVPGRTYDGKRCGRVIYRMDPDEISLTTRPRDPRCFRTWIPIPAAEVRERSATGEPVLESHHCGMCSGRAGATRQDLDPASWPTRPEPLIASSVELFRSAR
jgi:hypothetical protein